MLREISYTRTNWDDQCSGQFSMFIASDYGDGMGSR